MKTNDIQGFDSEDYILRYINDTGGYTWKPKRCNGRNHVLSCTLNDLVEEGYLDMKDVGSFWNGKSLYTITEKGIKKITN